MMQTKSLRRPVQLIIEHDRYYTKNKLNDTAGNLSRRDSLRAREYLRLFPFEAKEDFSKCIDMNSGLMPLHGSTVF
jgi:hypothetical protein